MTNHIDIQMDAKEKAKELLNLYIRNATEVKRGEWNFFQQEEVNEIVDLIVKASKDEIMEEVKTLLYKQNQTNVNLRYVGKLPKKARIEE